MTTREELKTIDLGARERLEAEARLARAEAVVDMIHWAAGAMRAFVVGAGVGAANFARRLRSPRARQAG